MQSSVGTPSVMRTSTFLPPACSGAAGVICLELAIAAGQRGMRRAFRSAASRRGACRGPPGASSSTRAIGDVGARRIRSAARRRVVRVGEDDEPRADARVAGGLHLGEDRLESRDDGGPLVVLVHAARAIEHEEQVHRLPLGLRRGRRAARRPAACPWRRPSRRRRTCRPDASSSRRGDAPGRTDSATLPRSPRHPPHPYGRRQKATAPRRKTRLIGKRIPYHLWPGPSRLATENARATHWPATRYGLTEPPDDRLARRCTIRPGRHEIRDGADVAVERPVLRQRRDDATRTAACAAATPRLGASGER